MTRRARQIVNRKSTIVNAQAFTLAELLVVIAIIALLLAILIPTLGKARRHARAAACQMNLRQWGTTLALVAGDNEGRFLRDDSKGRAMTPLWILTGRCFGEMTNDHLQPPRQYHPISTKGMLCPEATTPGTIATGGGVYGFGGITWRYDIKPGGTNRAWVLTESGGPTEEVRISCVSYGLNDWLFRRAGRPLTLSERMEETMEAMKGPQPPSYINIFLLRRPASVPLLLDCAGPSGAPTDDEHPPTQAEYPWGAGMGGLCMDRHSGHINGLFLDWSVRKVGLKELWTLKWYQTFNTANKWTKAGGVTPDQWPPWMRQFKDY